MEMIGNASMHLNIINGQNMSNDFGNFLEDM